MKLLFRKLLLAPFYLLRGTRRPPRGNRLLSHRGTRRAKVRLRPWNLRRHTGARNKEMLRRCLEIASISLRVPWRPAEVIVVVSGAERGMYEI